MALTDKLSAIADAIRAKTGKTDGLTLEQMPTEIASIETGGGSAEGCVTVTFMNGDTELFSRPVYIGDDCPNPIAQGRFDTPTKESTAQYNYVFYGWGASDGGAADGNILKNITEDKTVYAVFTAVVRTYTITYYDSDGATVLKTEQLAYGAMPSYIPNKDGAGFAGWQPEPTTVIGIANYIATWEEVITLANASWEKIAQISEAGEAANYFSVGDKKDIVLNYSDGTTTTVTVEIAGFSMDELADSTNKAGITFALTSAYRYEAALIPKPSLATNAKWGYDDTDFPTTILPNIFNALPYELQQSIKSVYKPFLYNTSNKGKTACTTKSANYCYQLWLFGLEEIGITPYAAKTGCAAYPIFQSDTNRKKTTGDKNWWTRDVDYNQRQGTLNVVNYKGQKGSLLSVDVQAGIVFGFCI